MKTSGEIRFDFQNAMQQARKLDELADSIERRVVGKLQGQIRQTARSLRSTAEDIRRIARRIYEAEMRALEIAQSRKA